MPPSASGNPVSRQKKNGKATLVERGFFIFMCQIVFTPVSERGLGEETLASLVDQTPAGRLGTPEDVARAVAFFLRDVE